jgi:hypothetical protein
VKQFRVDWDATQTKLGARSEASYECVARLRFHVCEARRLVFHTDPVTAVRIAVELDRHVLISVVARTTTGNVDPYLRPRYHGSILTETKPSQLGPPRGVVRPI